MTTYYEDLEERLRLEEEDERTIRSFDLKVTETKYGTVTVEAHSLEEAKEKAQELDESEIDWNDWDFDAEEDE